MKYDLFKTFLPKSDNYNRLAEKLSTDKLAAFIKRDLRLVMKWQARRMAGA